MDLNSAAKTTHKDLLVSILKSQGRTADSNRLDTLLLAMRIHIFFVQMGALLRKLAYTVALAVPTILLFAVFLQLSVDFRQFFAGIFGVAFLRLTLEHRVGMVDPERLRGIATDTIKLAISESEPDPESKANLEAVMDRMLDKAAREAAEDPTGPKA